MVTAPSLVRRLLLGRPEAEDGRGRRGGRVRRGRGRRLLQGSEEALARPRWRRGAGGGARNPSARVEAVGVGARGRGGDGGVESGEGRGGGGGGAGVESGEGRGGGVMGRGSARVDLVARERGSKGI